MQEASKTRINVFSGCFTWKAIWCGENLILFDNFSSKYTTFFKYIYNYFTRFILKLSISKLNKIINPNQLELARVDVCDIIRQL